MNKEINPELLKSPEIEQIFNKIEKVPCVGGVLVSVFKENTSPESWEIIGNHEIYGKVTKIKFGEYTPVMKLDNYSENRDAYLTIFDLTKSSPKEIDRIEWYKDVAQFGAHIEDIHSLFPRIYISCHFSWRNFRLPDDKYIKYNNWLAEVVSDINTKAVQSHIGEKVKELQKNDNRQRYPDFYK